MPKKPKMEPYANLKPGQKAIEIKDLSFNEGTAKDFKKTKKQREEQRAMRRAQNKSTRQFLKSETKKILENLQENNAQDEYDALYESEITMPLDEAMKEGENNDL